MDQISYQCTDQINGRNAHSKIDGRLYNTKNTILQGQSVLSNKFGLIGKIDVFDTKMGIITERKKKITHIYDGYVFQVYAQYFSLIEMGYSVNRIRLYSFDDNKMYEIKLPPDDPDMLNKFICVINDIKSFNFNLFIQNNKKKCEKCIYEPMCGKTST